MTTAPGERFSGEGITPHLPEPIRRHAVTGPYVPTFLSIAQTSGGTVVPKVHRVSDQVEVFYYSFHQKSRIMSIYGMFVITFAQYVVL